MNDVEVVQTLEDIYKIFKDSQVAKKRWFGTRPKQGWWSRGASSILNIEMLEIFTEGYSTPLVLPSSADGIINPDNKEIYREIRDAWNAINNYLKHRRERAESRSGPLKIGVSDLDPRTLFWKELLDRLRDISYMPNKTQILVELDLVLKYLTEITSNPANLFPQGIDDEKTTRGTIVKVKQLVTDAISALTSKEEVDPLPVLCEDLAVSLFNMSESLLQFCFIQLRGDEFRSDFSSIATFVSLRDLVAPSTKNIYSKPLSQLCASLANKLKSKILFPSGAKQYQVSHRAKRTDEVYRYRLKAMKEPHSLFEYANAQELEKTPYARKEGGYRLKYLPTDIAIMPDGKNVKRINLFGSDSDIEAAFLPDEVLISNMIVLIGYLENIKEDVLLAEDAQHCCYLIGEFVNANFAGNAYSAAENVILDCDAILELLKIIHDQCLAAELSKLGNVKYIPLNSADPYDKPLNVSKTWIKNHEHCKKLYASLITGFQKIRDKALILKDKALKGFSEAERKKVSQGLQHFSGTTALLQQRKNIQLPQCILEREDPDGKYWKIKPEEYALVHGINLHIFVTLLVKQLPVHIRNDLLNTCRSSSFSNYDLIIFLCNQDFMSRYDRTLNDNKHLKLHKGDKDSFPNQDNLIPPNQENIIIWILKLFIQKSFAPSKMTDDFKTIFRKNIKTDLIKVLPDLQVFLIGYMLGQTGSSKPSEQFNDIVEYLEYRAEMIEEKLQKLLTENVNKPAIAQTRADLDAVHNYLGLLGIARGIPQNAVCDLGHMLQALNHHQIQQTIDTLIHPEMEGSNIGLQLQQFASNKLHHGKVEHTLQLFDRRQASPSTPPVPREPGPSSRSQSNQSGSQQSVPAVPMVNSDDQIIRQSSQSQLKPPAAARGTPSSTPQFVSSGPPPAAASMPDLSLNDIEAEINQFAEVDILLQRKRELEAIFVQQNKKFTPAQMTEYKSIQAYLKSDNGNPPPINRLSSAPEMSSSSSSAQIIAATTVQQQPAALPSAASSSNIVGLQSLQQPTAAAPKAAPSSPMPQAGGRVLGGGSPAPDNRGQVPPNNPAQVPSGVQQPPASHGSAVFRRNRGESHHTFYPPPAAIQPTEVPAASSTNANNGGGISADVQRQAAAVGFSAFLIN